MFMESTSCGSSVSVLLQEQEVFFEMLHEMSKTSQINSGHRQDKLEYMDQPSRLPTLHN